MPSPRCTSKCIDESKAMSPQKVTVLSRFFDENTYLVAGVCSRCHRENTDVKIVAVNRRFLRQVELRKRAKNESESKLARYEPVWHPPKSPHNLIEESLYADPWALLVATIFLNKTAAAVAKPHIDWFLSDFPDPLAVLKCEPAHLEKYFETIGLRKRARQVWRMSHDFVHKNWTDAKELHGIGVYGRDAFDMFCMGRMHVEPKDRFLRIYKAWFEMREKENKRTALQSEYLTDN